MTKKKHPASTRRQCTAKSKQSGKQCKNRPVAGREVCHIHGGKTPVGIASPHYKTGEYTPIVTPYGAVMPQALQRHYSKAQETAAQLELGDDIALHRALIMQVLEAMERGESGELWAQLEESKKQYQRAKRGKAKEGEPTMEEALATIFWLIDEGSSEYMLRIELRQLLQERVKLLDAEGKRQERERLTVPLMQAYILIDKLGGIIRRYVSDPIALRYIAADFRVLTRGETQPQLGGGGEDGDDGSTGQPLEASGGSTDPGPGE